MICLDNLSFSYPPKNFPLITSLNLTIKTSSWVALIGPDGSGKTTLAKIISGLLQPDTGSVCLGPSVPLSISDVGYVGGDPYDSFVGISVEEDIVFGLENLQLPPQEIRRRLDLAIGWTRLTGMERRLLTTLSGGEQQKVVLAGILAAGARNIVLDEAISMLDRGTRAAIRSLLNVLRRNPGLTIVEISQNLEDALQSDRILFLDNGEILFDGSPQGFLSCISGAGWSNMAFGVGGLLGALYKSGSAGDASLNRSDLINSIISKFNLKIK